MLSLEKPALFLAPMEGVTDYSMRELLTEWLPFTHAVSEFMRVGNPVQPARTFLSQMPELGHGGRTRAGVPVIFQILGGDPVLMAQGAARAASLGAPSVDINFGCPSPRVNGHDGGATLLKYPDRIFSIVKAVREQVPSGVPVSAKLRLGWDCIQSIDETADAAVRGGVSWLTIHGRTRMQGYQPPAYWKPIGEIRKRYSIPVIANGEIWSVEDFERCREETGCNHFMLGRGAMANPALVFHVARRLGLYSGDYADEFPNPSVWEERMHRFLDLAYRKSENPNYGLRKVKQWYRYIEARRPDLPVFTRVKRMSHLNEFTHLLKDGLWTAKQD